MRRFQCRCCGRVWWWANPPDVLPPHRDAELPFQECDASGTSEYSLARRR